MAVRNEFVVYYCYKYLAKDKLNFLYLYCPIFVIK